jgi:peroxiredoxin
METGFLPKWSREKMEKAFTHNDEQARSRVINKLKKDNTHKSFEHEIDRLKEKLLDSNLSHKAFNRILKSIDILQSASIAPKFLNIGDQAPDFELKNTLGQSIKLSEAVKKGKVILSFYRGGWCPFCYLELRALQKINSLVKKDGTKIIGISPESIEDCKRTIERNQLQFDILSDKANRITEQYNLIAKNDRNHEALLDISLESAIDNGDISYQLPVPAIFVVDEWMTIRFAFQSPDYRKRVNINLLLDCLRQI